MAVNQLTLYDVLADLIPGAFALVLLGGIAVIVGIFEIPSMSGLGTGLLFAIVSYLVGRSVHALAGQQWTKRARRKSDKLIFWHLKQQNFQGYDQLVREPEFGDFLRQKQSSKNGTEYDNFPRNGSFNRGVQASISSLAATKISQVTEAEIRNHPHEFRRFAYSYLFDSSTLYQRYNIQETFYRNLWLVTAGGAIAYSNSALVFGLLLLFSGIEDYTAFAMSAVIALILVLLSVLFAIRRIQFKYRQERALVNDLYLHFTDDLGDSETREGSSGDSSSKLFDMKVLPRFSQEED